MEQSVAARPPRSCIWPGCRTDISHLYPNTSYCFPHKSKRQIHLANVAARNRRYRDRVGRLALEAK